MKLWITRNKAGRGKAFKAKPRFDKKRDWWFVFKYPTGIDIDFGLDIGELFPEVTFENSPKEVEIKLI